MTPSTLITTLGDRAALDVFVINGTEDAAIERLLDVLEGDGDDGCE
jgi:hypothetical protein